MSQTTLEQIPISRISTNAIHSEKIEILSVDLLDQNRPLVESLKKLARSLHLEFGWHYLLDLAWIIKNLGSVSGKRIMDAGAGVGVMQWYLAQQGAEVISVDRLSRAGLAMRFRSHFRVRGLREMDLLPAHHVLLNDFGREISGPFYRRYAVRSAIFARNLLLKIRKPRNPGEVLIYNQDLSSMVDIPENSLDAVVAVSSLEHNTIPGLKQVVTEILRVLKPDGILLVTLNASRHQDWWHGPSRGWCLTEASLREIFNFDASVPSNYSRYDPLFNDLYNCAELRNNLANFYFTSDKNGMPLGVWEPRYQPVGICKIKKALSLLSQQSI